MSLSTNHLLRINRKASIVLLILAVTLLGAWKIIMGDSINPSYVERIQDGKTKRHEILTLFGDPQETKRTPEGLVLIYKSYRTKETLPSRDLRNSKNVVADNPYFQEYQMSEVQSTKKKGSNKELASSLTIRFKPDGETVQSHEYKEY
jgi:hypothetical protein